jgi:uncharacterized membrane protein YfcA
MALTWICQLNTFLQYIHSRQRRDVHMAEVVATGISGFSLETRQRGLNGAPLTYPGMIGGVSGAYLLTAIDGNIIAHYRGLLLIMGGLSQAFKIKPRRRRGKSWSLVGAGLLEASAELAAGLGPVVTSSLVARKHHV